REIAVFLMGLKEDEYTSISPTGQFDCVPGLIFSRDSYYYTWRNKALRLTSLNDITTKYRHIFLSPHFDDVVYSCGGTLGVQVSCGLRPLVITIFSGPPAPNQELSPLAIQEHRKMGVGVTQEPGYAIEVRQKEDAAALDYLQADYLWLDYPE